MFIAVHRFGDSSESRYREDWAGEGSRFEPQCGQSFGGLLVVVGGGTLEQDTKLDKLESHSEVCPAFTHMQMGCSTYPHPRWFQKLKNKKKRLWIFAFYKWKHISENVVTWDLPMKVVEEGVEISFNSKWGGGGLETVWEPLVYSSKWHWAIFSQLNGIKMSLFFQWGRMWRTYSLNSLMEISMESSKSSFRKVSCAPVSFTGGWSTWRQCWNLLHSHDVLQVSWGWAPSRSSHSHVIKTLRVLYSRSWRMTQAATYCTGWVPPVTGTTCGSICPGSQEILL